MDNRRSVEELKAEGNKYFSAKDYPAAIKAYTQGIILDPNNYLLYSNRSAAYLLAGNYELALGDATHSIDLAPTWGKGYFRQGKAFEAMNLNLEAISSYELGLKYSPGNKDLTAALDRAVAGLVFGMRQKEESENQVNDCNNISKLKEIFGGRAVRDVMHTLDNMIPKAKLLIFVSSTFTDTHKERDILHQKILQQLQKQAVEHGVQVNLYDMRFGVRDENTCDHMTWIACKDAINQCFQQSDGLFFLSLQGDKYGYTPIPKYIDKDTLDTLIHLHIGDNSMSDALLHAREWYFLDENHLPPRYELKKLKTLDDSTFWRTVLPTLRDKLLDNCTFEEVVDGKEQLLVNHSVTEWETLLALNTDVHRCYWIRRHFDLAVLTASQKNPKYWELSDVMNNPDRENKLRKLTTKMEQNLSPIHRIHDTTTVLHPDAYLYNEAEGIQ